MPGLPRWLRAYLWFAVVALAVAAAWRWGERWGGGWGRGWRGEGDGQRAVGDLRRTGPGQ